MAESFDVIVIGLGGFGSSTLYELAKRGVRAVGIDQFDIGHCLGSSHGETRIIRRAYFEHPDYVPLLNHTYDMWKELESESGKALMNLTGLVLSGSADGEAVSGVRKAQELHDVRIENLTHADAADRFPQIRFPEHHTILFEDNAGYLRVDDCVRTHIQQAISQGATVRARERVVGWEAAGDSVTVRTEKQEYSAARLVVAAGAWAERLLDGFGLSLSVIRKPTFWFPTEGSAADWPIFYYEEAGRSFYGLPGLDGTSIKVAEHSGGEPVQNPTNLPREQRASEHADIASFVTESLIGVEPVASNHSVCMYTMSQDGHFIVDQHPSHGNVTIAAGFSGHGFKFTPVIGRALADLAMQGESDLPIEFLRLNRGQTS